jgi:aryl-alcohol dehydrogenase-like predicted oxidoreductase
VIKHYPRERIQITTKWGASWSPEGQLVRDLSRSACREAVEGSLKRLGLDYVDMLVLRGPAMDPKNTPFEETIGAMKVLAT